MNRLGVALIVVTHNSSKLLKSFAGALPRAARSLALRTVVVDSGSSDGTVAHAAAIMPEADIRELGSNGGFAAGINAGVAHVRSTGGASVFVVANPDMTLSDGCLLELVAALDHGTVGIVAPRLIDEHGGLQPSLRNAPSVTRTWCDAILGGPLAARLHFPTEVIRDERRYAIGGEAVWATGGLLAISDSCLSETGEWDESLFMYEEEVDFCLRARRAGYSLRYVPAAEAIRFVGDGPVQPWAHALMRRNRAVLAQRYYSRMAASAMWTGSLVGETVRAVAGRPASRAAVWALMRAASPDRIMARYSPKV